MGGGGFARAMNIAIKNNRKLLPKRDRFKRTFGKYSNDKKPEYNFPKAQAHVLRQIRERLIEERKQRTKKRVILFMFLVMSIVTVLMIIL